jgi:hypothetical protein
MTFNVGWALTRSIKWKAKKKGWMNKPMNENNINIREYITSKSARR